VAGGLLDADPAWLRRVEKVGRGLMGLFTVPIVLFQCQQGIRAYPWVAAALCFSCAVLAALHLRAAWILSEDVWLEAADEAAQNRRSWLHVMSWCVIAALLLTAVGAVFRDDRIVCAGLALSQSMAIALWLDFQFIALIAARMPDADLAQRARRAAGPVSIGLSVALAIFALQIFRVFRVHPVVPVSIFVWLPFLIYSTKVTNAFTRRVHEIRTAVRKASAACQST
jgi:hypothetical protein